MEASQYAFLGDYLNGQFVRAKRPDDEFETFSPSNLKDLILEATVKYAHVTEACEVAKSQFPMWSNLAFEDRKQALNRLKELILNEKEPLAAVLSRETGRPLWDTTQEISETGDLFDVTLNIAFDYIKEERLENLESGGHGTIVYRPRGVAAVVASFSNPLHFTISQIVPALAAGNPVVFKPSERTPAFGQHFAQLVDKADFPNGVFNMVQGPAEVGRRLIADDRVESVMFSGAYETGLKIKQDTLNHFWKIFSMQLGGKNAAIVFPDADIDQALAETLIGSFISSGQRCTSTSRILLHADVYDSFVERFYESAKKLSIGNWDESPFMGSLISKSAVENYVRFQGIAKREGAESLMRGKIIEREPGGHYVTPSICTISNPDPESIYQKTEIRGPNVAIYKFEDVEEATKLHNLSSYGLICSVFTAQKNLLNDFNKNLRVGVLNWNCATTRSNARLPAGGRGKSGTHRPFGVFSVMNSTVPVTVFEGPSGETKNPGMPNLELG